MYSLYKGMSCISCFSSWGKQLLVVVVLCEHLFILIGCPFVELIFISCIKLLCQFCNISMQVLKKDGCNLNGRIGNNMVRTMNDECLFYASPCGLNNNYLEMMLIFQ